MLLAASLALLDQPLAVAPDSVATAAAAAETIRPTRLYEICPALLIRAEPRQKTP
jgi:hypothetical protein